MEFPEPVIEIAVEPKTKGDQEKLGVALSRLAAEDPSFRVSTDQECGQTIIKGMGELHLDIKVDILQRTYKVDVNVGAAAGRLSRDDHPRRSTIDYTHKKQSGGSGQFARVKLELEPERAGRGLRLRSRRSSAARCRRNSSPASRRASSVLTSGVLAGFPVVDIKVALIDGAYHDVDSSALAFEIAVARGASAKRSRRPVRCCSSRS